MQQKARFAMEDLKGLALSKQLVVKTLLGYGIFGAASRLDRFGIAARVVQLLLIT